MKTKFDIGEEVCVKNVKVVHISIDDGGKITYRLSFPNSLHNLDVKEDQLEKIINLEDLKK